MSALNVNRCAAGTHSINNFKVIHITRYPCPAQEFVTPIDGLLRHIHSSSILSLNGTIISSMAWNVSATAVSLNLLLKWSTMVWILCNLLLLGNVTGKIVVLSLKWSMEMISLNQFRVMVADIARISAKFPKYILRFGNLWFPIKRIIPKKRFISLTVTAAIFS